MRFPNLLHAVFIVLFCCLGWQNAKADITNPCAIASYQCDSYENGEILVIIIIDYETATEEWLDCVTFNLPSGWLYVPGSELGLGTDADGNYISDAGSSVTFGTFGFCPGGDSDFSILGEAPNSFAFNVLPPPGWDPGDCFTEGDGDPIVGITWDYTGDGYGEAGATISGVNGDATIPFDIMDTSSPCESDIIPVDETLIFACPQEVVQLGVDPLSEPRCGGDFILFFDDINGGTGGLAGGFSLSNVPLPYSFDADLNGLLSANGFPPLGGIWCVTGVFAVGNIFSCEQTEEICIVYSDPNDPACQNIPTCTANFASFTDECDFVIPGPDCMLDELVLPGNTGFYEIFYETDGSGSDGIVSASGTYTTGQDILNNLNSGFPGEVIFRELPGDCNGIPKASLFNCTPLTLDVYIVPIEYNAVGNPTAVAPTCPVETISLTFYPTQADFIYVETPGDCDTPATISIGYDLGGGDGAGDEPDGDLNDAADILCSVIESPLPPSFPCGGADNTETTPPLTATELANLLGFANPDCYTDVAAAAEAVCPTIPCPACNAEAPSLAVNQTTCPDGTMGGPLSLNVSGGTSNPGEITEYIYSNDTGTITGFTTLAEAEAAIAGFAPEDEVCLNVITYVQSELDGVLSEINDCTGGLFASLGVPTTGVTLNGLYDTFINVFGISITINDFEALVAGMNGGPGLGGTSSLEFLLPGLTCPNIPPFCYQLNTLCITGVEYVICPTCDDPCANNTGELAPCTYDPDYDICDDGCEFTTDMYNNTTCQCDFVLTTPTCDDNDPNTDDSYDEANCVCVNTPAFNFELSDPCNCFAGLDLDSDGQNEFATETYTFSNGTVPYMVSNITGTLYDNAGTPYTVATLEAWIAANDPGTGADFDVVVYVDADGVSIYSLEITDGNGIMASTMGGPCTTCSDIAAIPTLGEWGMIILALLMSIVAVVGIRQRKIVFEES